MRHLRNFTGAAALALACAAATACNLIPGLKDSKSSDSPTSPTTTTPTISMDSLAGTWSSTTAGTPATGCGNVKYTVTPIGATSANVVFDATCGGTIALTGSGNGTLSGGAMNWSASGLVGQGGVNCPFTFSNGKATPDTTAGTLTIVYSGTVCGIPVSGTETVKK